MFCTSLKNNERTHNISKNIITRLNTISTTIDDAKNKVSNLEELEELYNAINFEESDDEDEMEEEDEDCTDDISESKILSKGRVNSIRI